MTRPGLVLTTERTVLTPFAVADAPALLAVFRDPDVRAFLLDDVLVGPAWIEAEVAASEQRFARFGTGLWSVRLTTEPAILGFVGFREFLDPPELQLLYGLLPASWGKGLATEVTARVCDYALRELGRDRVTATTDLPNRASARVLRHLGMQVVRVSDEGDAGTAHFAIDRETWCARLQTAGS